VSAVVDPASSARTGLLLLAPMRIEARSLKAGLPTTRVVRTGIGPVNSVETARSNSTTHRSAAVAVAGVAGGLVPGMETGTLVVADRILDESGSTIAMLDSAALLAAALRSRGLDVVTGPIISTERVARGGDARAALAAKGAIAVDMESAALLREQWGAPVAVVRAISDTPERELGSRGTITGGVRALAALRSVVGPLEEWADAASTRRLLLAGPRSFCAGVERAISTVERALDMFGAPVFVRRQIVHNRHVVADLEGRGAVFVHELDEVPDGATVVFSAHGVARSVRDVAATRGLRVVDATCPLVAKVHHEVRRFSDKGYQVVLIGHAGHDETEGTVGEHEGITILEAAGDVETLHVEDPEKVAYITQTTLSQDDVAGVVTALSERFPSLVGPHAADICYASQNRQDAVRSIASECDLMLVVGSPNSSNTARLVEVAERAGCRARMIDDETEIELNWLRGATAVGITAGASAPPELVERVVSALRGLGDVQVEERSIRTENVNFPLPMEVR
jgi:4-hydroxy-3-methylbut-2-en-1-yl diphosphate reductase